MKVKNFPARKLRRQLKAEGVDLNSPKAVQQLELARNVRTKKFKGKEK